MKRKNSTIGCPSVNRGSIGGRVERLYYEGMLEIRYFREKQNKVTMKSSKLRISCHYLHFARTEDISRNLQYLAEILWQ